uniref:site-specific integrase n=1 Tax=Cupriavidus taiwanensis TaxID=164546 RepID=UPI000E2E6F7D|nr:site-specific integrase [Cupriavidus taiwanensis]
MTTDTMKRSPGVYQRKRSSVWQWKIRAPKDLRHLYSSDLAENCSLGTSDLKEANLKAAQLRAEWLQKFATQRAALNPTKVDAITPAMAQFFAENVQHGSLSDDERLRTTPDNQAWLLRWMDGMGMSGADETPGEFGGMPDALADMLEGMHEEHHAVAKKALARGHLDKALPALLRVAAQAGITFDEDTPGYKEALQEVSKAIRHATEAKVKRDQGDIVDTPPPPDLKAIEAAKKPRTLRSVFDLWKEAKKRGKDSVTKTDRALAMFEALPGNPALADIRREHGIAFQSWLLKQDLASKTQHDTLTWVKSLLNFAYRDLEWIAKNPWIGLDIAYGTENEREPWTPKQLQAFFSQPLFARYELPQKQWRAGKDAAYWIPLLGLFTGARLSELCQLRVADVFERDGLMLISINEKGEGSAVKTAASVRNIPAHSELARLGFLEYVDATRKAGHERLWPDLKFRDGKAGGNFSVWFGEARKMGGSEHVVPDFHALRHTVRSALHASKVDQLTQDRITGHKAKGSIGATVYTHISDAQLRDAVEAIRYPGLALEKVYVTP